MDSLVYEDKSGQSELFSKQDDTDSDSDNSTENDSSDCEQESLFKPGSSKTSSCWEDLKKLTNKPKNPALKRREDDDIDERDIYVDLGKCEKINYEVRRVTDMDDLMQKSVITPDFNRLHEIPTVAGNLKKAAKLRRAEREKTTGSKWFNMPAPEMTNKLKMELRAVQMRSVLDPKHFYKKNTMKTLPKYFQLGRIVESKAEYYSSRVPNKQRKDTLVEELFADAEFQMYNKRRYKEIILARKNSGSKANKHAKKLKKKKV